MSNSNHPVKSRKLPPLVFSKKSLIGNSSKVAHGPTNCTIPVSVTPVQNMVVRGRSPMNSSKYGNFLDISTIPTDKDNAEWTEESVLMYLEENPSVVDKYVMDKVSMKQIRKWIQAKVNGGREWTKHDYADDESETQEKNIIKWQFGLYKNKDNHAQQLTTEIIHHQSKSFLLSLLADCLVAVIDADGLNVYEADENGQNLTHIYQDSKGKSNVKTTKDVAPGSDIANYAATTKTTVRILNPSEDNRFPEGVSIDGERVQSALAFPIFVENAQLIGVIELYRFVGKDPFRSEDEDLAHCFQIWAGVLVHNIEAGIQMERERKLNEFLLAVTRSIFSDISMDTVIVKIMNFTKSLTNSDRASLFLLDTKRKELFSRIFDAGIEPEKYMGSEIRFPMDKGVAGYVASTGEILNIPDAYQDDRFNRDVDQQTGYNTKSILCMPISIRGKVIGVVQMVNKLSGPFTKADEEAFLTFSTYCGLALHYAKLYEKIRVSEQKYKVGLEMLSYHGQCTEEEYKQFCDKDVKRELTILSDSNFDSWSIDNTQKVTYVLHMGWDVFKNVGLDMNNFIRFVLTVRKNYRNVPYHNWTHAFSVAHSMYAIIKSSPERFGTLEGIALFIACLCHDLDHRGKTNQFMKLSASPLAALYTTSTMEQHHFNQTVTILQNEGHNIFNFLSPDEYKQMLNTIKECILATDLALFFDNSKFLRRIVDGESFNWDTQQHRKLLRSITMTGADLCASAKPWEIQRETVKVVFEEFYAQGDEEKAKGSTPIAMMDRSNETKLPDTQVGFISYICLPCYQLMSELLPKTSTMLNGAKQNLETWRSLAKKNEELDAKKNEELDAKKNEELDAEKTTAKDDQ